MAGMKKTVKKEKVSVLICETLFLDLFLGPSGVRRRLMKRKKRRKCPLSPVPKRTMRQTGTCRSMWKWRSLLYCPLRGRRSRISFQCRVKAEGRCCRRGSPGPGTLGNSSLAAPHAQAPDLQRVHKRIQDIVGVLRDFGTQREEGRSRAEYLHRLQRDLATYYSYGDFLLGKLMDLFPLSEVLNCQSNAHSDFLSFSP